MIFNLGKTYNIDTGLPIHQLCIPYMKFWQQDDMTIVS